MTLQVYFASAGRGEGAYFCFPTHLRLVLVEPSERYHLS